MSRTVEEMARHRCLGDDGTPLIVVEYRHMFTSSDGGTVRRHPGARWLALLDGEPVRPIDATTFEVVASGEMLRREGGD
ncbi:MAG: hypothetical protein ACAH11_10920 [Sphingomonas sp.]